MKINKKELSNLKLENEMSVNEKTNTIDIILSSFYGLSIKIEDNNLIKYSLHPIIEIEDSKYMIKTIIIYDGIYTNEKLSIGIRVYNLVNEIKDNISINSVFTTEILKNLLESDFVKLMTYNNHIAMFYSKVDDGYNIIITNKDDNKEDTVYKINFYTEYGIIRISSTSYLNIIDNKFICNI